MRRTLRYAASRNPSSESSSGPSVKKGSPGANRTWATNVSPMSHRIGLIARQSQRPGTLLRAKATAPAAP